jgi:hypothetical protein
MLIVRTHFLTAFFRALAASAFLFLLALGAVHAQALPQGVRLGMSAEELQAALPSLEHVRRPQRLAGGLAGSWRTAPVEMAGLMFEPTFYFAAAQLRRVEFVASAPDGGEAAFAELVNWGRGVFGSELASNDPGSAYAAWTRDDADVYAQRTGDARHATVRLVYKARDVRDGSEL